METPGDKDEQEHETSAKDRGSQPKTGALKVAVLKGQGYPSDLLSQKHMPKMPERGYSIQSSSFCYCLILPSGMGWYCASVQFEGTDQ